MHFLLAFILPLGVHRNLYIPCPECYQIKTKLHNRKGIGHIFCHSFIELFLKFLISKHQIYINFSFFCTCVFSLSTGDIRCWHLKAVILLKVDLHTTLFLSLLTIFQSICSKCTQNTST